MSKTRTENSIRNSTVALLSQGIIVLLSFITRTIFIKNLGANYLGINGLFTNILTVLSFAELGFGTAIVYALYKPLAENDYNKISALMNFYSKVYRFIGIFVLISGIILVPYLNFFINDVKELPGDMPPLWIVYILYLLNSSVSYFFNYKRSIVIASQNGYLDSLNQLTFTFVRNVVQILILIVFKDFLLYLIVQVVCTLLSNIIISIKADKLFPYLKEKKKEKLNKENLKEIVKNVSAMSFHKFGSVIVSGTDSILISKFVGVIAAGYYSNYVLLTTTVKTVYIQILSPITASVGNFVTSKTEDEVYKFFKKLFFLNAYIAIFCTSCLTSLVNPFISLLWGDEYTFSNITVYLIMFSFFINCMRQVSNIFIDTNGLFWQIRWKSFFEAIINFTVCLFLVKSLKLGVTGIVLGTIVSNIMTNFWWEPYVVHKFALKKPLLNYFISYSKVLVVYLITLLITLGIESYILENFAGFVIKSIISFIVPNLIIWIIYRKTEEYKYFLSIVKKYLFKKE